MTTDQPIKALFANNIHRRIEEVIKVDQADEEIIRDEINEYVVTDAIRRHYTRILEEYRQTPHNPREGIAIWVSGFFGSGKSSFAKMLGLSIENRMVDGEPAAERFAQRAGDNRIQVLLKAISEHIPTHAVIFDVSTDRGIRSGNQTLTEIMYGLFLQSLGYAKDLDLSELEIALEEKSELAGFEQEYARLFHKNWNQEKGKIAFALSEASRVLHSLDRETYPMADSWVKAVKNKADITPGKLAERATELMNRRRPGQALMFVVDEVGQFVARDVQKMLDLQAIVQRLGVMGRGRHWVVVTSQEKLGELVSGLDDKKIELARLMDRFPLQVHMEPSDISEVTSRRVLLKNATAQQTLGALFEEHRGRLVHHTRLTADIKLPRFGEHGEQTPRVA
ncbi:BREX system P-loop protein BrxC, partial [Sphaerisporangium sp. NPDC049002]|uniref:BREX system P-loop protein BrxC n=1 Tax=Sphaerisporangium sp. NPDC049002 TaxID=3155392 RepID=UPI0033F99A6A